MKQSDTPLGKAYVKAKESNPPPPPTPKKGDVQITVGKSGDDTVSRRYNTVQSSVIGADIGAEIVYDKVENKIMVNLTNQKTNERKALPAPYRSGSDYSNYRNFVVDAVKKVKGQPLNTKELKQISDFGMLIADTAAKFKIGGKYDA